ncbi:MAG: hypothetical protein Kow0060_10870 [Methylohalobius crimeensis]
MRAYFLDPRNLSVLVALYRFYYYQHRLEDARMAAFHALAVSGERLGLPADWSQLDWAHLGHSATRSMGLLRFYLLALKGVGYLNLRLGASIAGMAMLAKVREMDPQDQLGTGALSPALNDRDQPCAIRIQPTHHR